MSSWTRFLLTGAVVLPAMVMLLHRGEATGALAICFSVILSIAALIAKVIQEENEAETPETCKERERRAEIYSIFGSRRDDDS